MDVSYTTNEPEKHARWKHAITKEHKLWVPSLENPEWEIIETESRLVFVLGLFGGKDIKTKRY
jgi:hypothetical protein